MLISNYVEFMGFSSFDEITQDKLTKSFRKLAKQYHPDVCTGDSGERMKLLNEAYEELSRLLKELEALKEWEKLTNKNEVFAIIPFEQLFDIYSNKSIALSDGFELNKYTIRSNRIMLLIEVDIAVDGVVHKFSTFKPYNIRDNYEINCNIPITYDCDIGVIIMAYGKTVRLTLKSMTTMLTLKYNNNISLLVNLEKRFISKGGDG